MYNNRRGSCYNDGATTYQKSRSRFSGRGRGRAGYGGERPRLRLCSYYINRQCTNNTCQYAHAVKMHGEINASSLLPQGNFKSQNNYHHSCNNTINGKTYNNSMASVADLAIWEQQEGIKIFSGSHDGYWRLWDTSRNMEKEVEHNMSGGKVECLVVASNFLFCGFDGISVKVPGVKVGMIHAWNLKAPDRPPLEFHMGSLAPYAHASNISAIITQNDMCISASHDGTIRVWKYDMSPDRETGRFALVNTLCSHAGKVTGLVIAQSMLWSSSMDMTIRLWDLNTFECKHLITQDFSCMGIISQSSSPITSGSGVGHKNAVTSLVNFESQVVGGSYVISSSLDGEVKVWNSSNGDLMGSTNYNSSGIVCMALSTDLNGIPILICGTECGEIIILSLQETPNLKVLGLLAVIDKKNTNIGHTKTVNCIKIGPSNTFYSGGMDGKNFCLANNW